MTADLHTTSPTTPLALPPTAQDGGHTLLPWLREMRDEHPVWRDAHGVWHVFRYADVAQVISDPQMFSSDTGRVVPAAQRFSAGNLLQTDPPCHHQLRRLVGATFSPKVITGLAPRIAELTHELLDATDGATEFDLISALAYPLPVTVIAEPLQPGIPAAHALGGKLRVQRPAKPAAPMLGPDEEVFEVDAVYPVPREVPESQRERDDFAADLGDVAGSSPNKRCTQLRRSQVALNQVPVGRARVRGPARRLRSHRTGQRSDDRTFCLSLLRAKPGLSAVSPQDRLLGGLAILAVLVGFRYDGGGGGDLFAASRGMVGAWRWDGSSRPRRVDRRWRGFAAVYVAGAAGHGRRGFGVHAGRVGA
jgi:hypothetical protein